MLDEDIVTVKINERCSVHMIGGSIVGTREYQQDAYYMTTTAAGTLAVICDGMGGTEHGELASCTAVEILVSDFEKLESIPEPSAFLYEEVTKINDAVYEMRDEDGERIDCGSTLVAVLTVQNAAYWVSIGDSRIFIIRDKQMIPVNRLHNYGLRLDEQLRSEAISCEEYMEEAKNAEALISYIGMDALELIDRNEQPFGMQYQDKFLLCSDGLYKVLSEESILETISSNFMDIRSATLELIDKVQTSGKKSIDNTTVVLLSYE